MDGEGTVNKLQEGKPVERREKRETSSKGDGWCRIGLEECGCERVQNKSFVENRMDVCRGENQGQTYSAAVLNKNVVERAALWRLYNAAAFC